MSVNLNNSNEKQELGRDTPIDNLQSRFYTLHELANLLAKSYRSVQRYVEEGKIATTKDPGGRHQVSREEVMRLLGVTDDRTYFGYFESKFPHQNFIIYLLIETQFDYVDIRRRCKELKLPVPENNILGSLKQAIIKSAPRNIRRKLEAEYPVYRCHNYKSWMNTLGLEELYKNPTYPCLHILHDHSESRLHLEVLISAQISVEDILDYMRKKFKLFYTEEQVLFFQTYFYNLRDMTFSDYLNYTKYIRDLNEREVKLKCWHSPHQVRLLLSIPDRCDFFQHFNTLGELAYHSIQEKSLTGQISIQEIKQCVDALKVSHERVIKHKQIEKEEVSEAMQQAESSQENALVEQPHEDRVTFEELDQPEEKSDEGVAEKAG